MQMLNTNNPRELPKNQNRMLNDLSHMQKLQDSDQIELKKIKLNWMWTKTNAEIQSDQTRSFPKCNRHWNKSESKES